LHNSEEKLCNFGIADNNESLARIMTDRYVDDEGNEQIEMLWQELVPEEGDESVEWDDTSLSETDSKQREARKREAIQRANTPQDRKADEPLALGFTRDELDHFTAQRKDGLAEKSHYWIEKSSEALWACTEGVISHKTVENLREKTLQKYTSADSYSKVLSFAKSFLKFLATTRAEPGYQTFTPYLELPKAVKERKRITSRIVTQEDINNVLQHIAKAEREGEISHERSAQYSAFVLFGGYTGQRSEATIAKLNVGQFRTALALDKPVLEVDPSQDKIRMSHYVPLHPRVIRALERLLTGRNDDELMFTHSSFKQWIKRQKIPMSRFQKHFALGDLRKFAEQNGDAIQWEQSNRAYILTHGVSGVSWSHYRNPLPENVYDIYMGYWENVDFTV
jgi:integrase